MFHLIGVKKQPRPIRTDEQPTMHINYAVEYALFIAAAMNLIVSAGQRETSAPIKPMVPAVFDG